MVNVEEQPPAGIRPPQLRPSQIIPDPIPIQNQNPNPYPYPNPMSELESASVDQLIQFISDPIYRVSAMNELIKNHSRTQDLAVRLWESPNTVSVLLVDLITLFRSLDPPNLSAADSDRVCLVITLFQVIASHPLTKRLFIKAHMPIYLYPFLSVKVRRRAYDNLRLASLGVLGALVKNDDAEIELFLLETEIFPLCLSSMEYGSALSCTVATFIIWRMLNQPTGLTYCLETMERFVSVTGILERMLIRLATEAQPSMRLLKYIIGCYICLAGSTKLRDPRTSKEVLRRCYPACIRDGKFNAHIDQLQDSSIIRMLMQHLYENVNRPRV